MSKSHKDAMAVLYKINSTVQNLNSNMEKMAHTMNKMTHELAELAESFNQIVLMSQQNEIDVIPSKVILNPENTQINVGNNIFSVSEVYFQ